MVGGADAVVHLADGLRVFEERGAPPGPAAQDEAVARTESLAKAAVDAGVRTFVYLSSIKALSGETAEQEITAETRPAPDRSIYGKMKLRLEDALTQICTATPMHLVILRPPLVYGPDAGGNFGKLLALADSTCPLPVVASAGPSPA